MSKLNLVRYAREFWVTLAEFSSTRDTANYSDAASVKAAVRTFVVKLAADKYIAFRGEKQIKNILAENVNNPLFDPQDFTGTRTALIHWSMLPQLEERFKVDKQQAKDYDEFVKQATEHIESTKTPTAAERAPEMVGSHTQALLSLKKQVSDIEKEMEVYNKNRMKLLEAISILEGLEPGTTQKL
ncbi:hypothetical protein [Bacillus phage SDFMU_Pbc]|uniref:Uncharacterized protein n=1 Tax=Bacillus phage SDFMU_Pbc TaxID=3076135 RepID=A0AA96R2R7_9CAUD|nr:hypothetical protein [Bacillus phage SDFMU_Pbc]